MFIWPVYVQIEFKIFNPAIPLKMDSLAKEEDCIDEDSNSETDDCNGDGEDETESKNSYFNYNHSYDFVPNWIKDAKDKETIN